MHTAGLSFTRLFFVIFLHHMTTVAHNKAKVIRRGVITDFLNRRFYLLTVNPALWRLNPSFFVDIL